MATDPREVERRWIAEPKPADECWHKAFDENPGPPHGYHYEPWVRHSDYAALREKLEAAEAALRRMEGFDCCTCGPCALHPAALQRVRDEAWDECEKITRYHADRFGLATDVHREIRALRRAPTEGEG